MSANAAVLDTPRPDVLPPLKLIKQITAYRTSQCIRALVDLGIPEHLQRGPSTATELAAATGTKADLLARILDHMVNEDIIGKDSEGHYIPTSTTYFLVPGHDHTLHHWVACELHPLFWQSWENVVEQLKTGKSAFELSHGCPFFVWHAADTDAQKRFDDQMRDASLGMGGIVVQELAFPEDVTIVDVGGGDGSLLAQILDKNPGTRGVLFELPRADLNLNNRFEQLTADKRAKMNHGSFFDAIPAGGDVYLFSRVFHDFDDSSMDTILQNLKRVVSGQERLILIDIMVDAGDTRHRGSSQDVFMMTLLGGRERTFDEFSGILSRNGFEAVSITPTKSTLSILEFRLAE